MLQVAIEQLQSELTASRKEEAAIREEAQRVSEAPPCYCRVSGTSSLLYTADSMSYTYILQHAQLRRSRPLQAE
jgi:hypothetical protein